MGLRNAMAMMLELESCPMRDEPEVRGSGRWEDDRGIADESLQTLKQFTEDAGLDVTGRASYHGVTIQRPLW